MITDSDNITLETVTNPILSKSILEFLGWKKCAVHSLESEFFVNTTLFNDFWYSSVTNNTKQIFAGIYYGDDAFHLVWRETFNGVTHTVKVTNINSLICWTEFLLKHQNQLHK